MNTETFEQYLTHLKLSTENGKHKIKARKFTIIDAESNGNDFYTYPVVFHSWKEVNLYLRKKSITIEGDSYLKVRFEIEFANGVKLTDRYDVQRSEKEDANLGNHILRCYRLASGRVSIPNREYSKELMRFASTILDFYEIPSSLITMEAFIR